MKKMRKLVPAFAMLMVAAIMLSTASFAWFTMNDEVTASGMQIQAKATGSFVISTEPLTYASSKTAADITTDNTKLKPMTWNTSANAWQVPDADIDPHTGHFVDATNKVWKTLDFANTATTEYYVEKVLYIGSAGDKLTNQAITLELDALVAPDGEATKAYAMAIYVNSYRADSNDWAVTAVNATPAEKIIYVDDLAGRNTVTLTNGGAGYEIPSIVGVGAQDDKVTGLQIVIRFFVDGDLDAITDASTAEALVLKTKNVVTGYDYKAATEFSVNGAYYVAVKNVAGEVVGYEPAVITEGMTGFPEGVQWYTRSVVEEAMEYKYVNSDDVPTSGSTLEITISGETLASGN